MKHLLWAICLLLPVTSLGAPVRLAGEVELGLAPNWQLVGDSADYPFLLMSDPEAAEVLIFKSTIAASSTIDDQVALKLSVQRVIDSVVMTIPGAKLLSTTGYLEGDHARFSVDFTAEETPEDGASHHKLIGIIYRLPDGDQILYTLWARSPAASYSQYQEPIESMARDFRYVGEHAEDVFVVRSQPPRYYFILTVALMVCVVAWIRVRRHNGKREAQIGVETRRVPAE